MPVRKEQLNPVPIGPGRVWWPEGAPCRRIPWDGMYAIKYPYTEAMYERKNKIPEVLLDESRYRLR